MRKETKDEKSLLVASLAVVSANVLGMNPYGFQNNGDSYRNQYGIGNNGQFGQQVNLDSIPKQQRVLAYRSLLSGINSSQVQSLLFKIWTSRFYPNNNSPTLEQLQKFDLYEFEKWLNSLSESGIKNLSKEQNLSKYAQWKENLDRAYRLWLKTQSQNILGQLSNDQKLQKFIKDHNLKKQQITGKNHILTIQDISFSDTVQKFLNDDLNDKQKKALVVSLFGKLNDKQRKDLVVSLFGELSEKQKKALVLLLHRTNLQNPNIGSSLNQGVSADASALQDFLNSLNPATGTQETSVSQNTDRKGEQIITEKEIEDIPSQIIEDEQGDQSFSDPNEASSSQSAETEETSVSQNTDRKGKHEAKESEDVQEPARNIAAEVDDIVSQFREKYNILDMLNDIGAGNKVNTEAQSESQKIVGDLWEMGFSHKRIIELLGLKDDFEANYPSTTENLTDSSSDAGTSSSSSAAQTRKRNADSNVELTSSKKRDKGKQRAED